MGLGRYKHFPLIIGAISWLVLLVSMATNYWYVITGSQGHQTNEGLWKVCDERKCQKFTGNIENWFQAVRAFLLMAILASIAALVFYGIALRFIKLKVVFPFGLFITSTLVIFSLILYGIKKKTISNQTVLVEFGYSYIVAWASATLNIIATVLAIYEARKQTAAAVATVNAKTASNHSLDKNVELA